MSLFDSNITMRTINLLEKGMDVSMLRRDVLSNNIANVDVPNFKRSDVSFESDLKRAVDSIESTADQPPIETNNARHIAFFKPEDPASVQPIVHTDYLSTMRNDGNNVDMEDEVSKLVRNQMSYTLMADRIGAEFRQLNQITRLA